MKVVSLNVGLPREQHYGREVVWTAGAKTPVPNAVLRFHGFEGDGQADRINHGGADKGRSEDAGLIARLADLPEFGSDGRVLFRERLKSRERTTP